MHLSTSPNTAEIAKVLSQAFAKDPWIKMLFSGNAQKTQHFFEFIIKYCKATGGLVLCDYHDATLASVACLERPKVKVSLLGAINLLKALAFFIRKCGFKTLRKVNTYMRLTTRSRPKEMHHYLICIGVAPEFMGMGLGKIMLNSIHTLVEADTTSVGIGLDTENPNNVALYEHFGYRLTGTEPLDDLTIYTLFRPSKKSP